MRSVVPREAHRNCTRENKNPMLIKRIYVLFGFGKNFDAGIKIFHPTYNRPRWPSWDPFGHGPCLWDRQPTNRPWSPDHVWRGRGRPYPGVWKRWSSRRLWSGVRPYLRRWRWRREASRVRGAERGDGIEYPRGRVRPLKVAKVYLPTASLPSMGLFPPRQFICRRQLCVNYIM